jgi:hypothetical protein
MLLNGVGGRSQFGEIRSKRFPAYGCYSGKTTNELQSFQFVFVPGIERGNFPFADDL